MCGIAGFLEFKPLSLTSDPSKLIDEMLNRIIHRGPDDFGTRIIGYEKRTIDDSLDAQLDQNYVVLGHRRLSIIDLSKNASQPMVSVSGRLELVYNGEIYNYLELKKELTPFYSFCTDSDTEVILAAYEKWGIDMLSRFDGMFAFAMWDNENQELICARDSMGIKPFYYNLSERGFVFGSEPKVILAGLNCNGTIDEAHTAEFLTLGISDYDEGTFYNEVKQLKGGHYFILKHRELEVRSKCFWFRPDSIALDGDAEGLLTDLSEEYLKIVEASVKRQLRSDVPLGTSLSGGVDSSVIAYWAGSLLKEKAKGYTAITFSSPGFDLDESQSAKKVAEANGLIWRTATEPDASDLYEEFRQLITNMGEPFTSLSVLAQNRVMQRASQLGIKVMLDGQGGDEMYLGYPRVAQNVIFKFLRRGKVLSFLRELISFKRNSSISIMNALIYNVVYNTPKLAFWLKGRYSSRFTSEKLLSKIRPSLINDYFSYKPVAEKQLDELDKYCLPRLLRYADRNSMAYGVESRVPHLSNLSRDFALQLPINLRVKNGWTKYVVRKSMLGKLPSEILWDKQKKGFDIPQSKWLSNLKEDLITMVSEIDDGGIFKKEKILESINTAKGLEDPYLWRVLSVIAWISLTNVEFNYNE